MQDNLRQFIEEYDLTLVNSTFRKSRFCEGLDLYESGLTTIPTTFVNNQRDYFTFSSYYYQNQKVYNRVFRSGKLHIIFPYAKDTAMQDDFTASLRLQFMTDTGNGYLRGKDLYQSPLVIIPPVFTQYTGLAKEYNKEDWFVNTGWTHAGYEIYHRKFYVPNDGPNNFNGYIIFPNAVTDEEEEYLQDLLDNPEPAEEDWMI